MKAFLVIIACGAWTTAASAQFWSVGVPVGHQASRAYGLSSDGQTAAGFATGELRGFTWTAAGGRVDMPASPWTLFSGISGDGTTVVGQVFGDGYRAVRRVGDGPLEDLGSAGSYTHFAAQAAGSDGDTVIGNADFGPTSFFGQAFRWTESGGMQLLGYTRPNDWRSVAAGISRDSQVVVGYSEAPNGVRQAFRWMSSTGMIVLPDAPGSTDGSTAIATNADGSIVVGHSGRAVVWREDQLQILGLPQGFDRQGGPVCVNDAGSVLGGYVTQIGDNVAAVWTDAGAFTLAQYLTDNGVTSHQGWSLFRVSSMSSDGTVFAGYGRSPAGRVEGFIAQVPSTPSLALVTVVGLMSCHRRRRGYPVTCAS